jgi:glycerate 2-kinase
MDQARYAVQLEELHASARDIFLSSLQQSSIPVAFDRHLHFDGTELVLHPFPSVQHMLPATRIDLAKYKSILVISLGKAAVTMLESLLARLPKKLKVRGLCCAPQKPEHRSWRFHYFAAGHPLPNADSFRAAETALRLLRRTTEKSFVFFLVSGGGSTLFELPLDPSISLEDTVAFHQALISCGATISEINTVRKHFSAVKGGRLAEAAPEAQKITLQLADVPLRHLDALASAPTLPDRSTVADCREVLARYGLLERFPAAVRAFFSRPDLPETPGEKSAPAASTSASSEGIDAAAHHAGPGSEAAVTTANSSLDTLLSNHDLINAARDRASALGFRVVIDNTCDDWPYDRAAAYLLGRFAELRKEHPRLCLLSGGEVTVQLAATHGTGGRNQQFALACAQALAAQFSAQPVVVLSAGSDGIDGNSSAAGALVDPTTISRAENFGFHPERSLAAFDACPLLSALGDTVVTGRTGNNLRDLRILLSADPPVPSTSVDLSK